MTNNKQPTKQTDQKTVFIRFMAPFDPRTSDELFRIIDEKIKQKYSKII